MNKEKIQILLAIGFRYYIETHPNKFRYFKTAEEAKNFTSNVTWNPIFKIEEYHKNTFLKER